MRSPTLLAVAVLAVAVGALLVSYPTQPALATATITLNVSPTSVVQGESITFSGTETPASPGSTTYIFVGWGPTSLCEQGGTYSHSYSTAEDSSGNYQATVKADYPAGQYWAISGKPAIQLYSDCVPFTVSASSTPTRANQLTILMPYVALIVLIAAVSATAAVVVKKKRKK
jgi:hypothetical protein